MKEYRKIQTIELVEEITNENYGRIASEVSAGKISVQGAFGTGYVVQNKGDDSDRWIISKKVFEGTYEEVKETPSEKQGNTFLDRLQNECRELVIKKVALQNFFGNPTFPNLAREDKALLYEQDRLMSRYIEILGLRIELAGSKYKVE